MNEARKEIAETKSVAEKSLGGAFAGIATAGIAAAAVVAGKAIHSTVGFIHESIDAARDAEQSSKKLDSVLRSTGGAAGLTGDEIRKLAKDLEMVTNFADDATVSAAAVLATFTSIKGDVFKDALKSAQDLSSVMGQDLQSSIVQIGKALNNPTEGLKALSRVGVSFTEDQKKMIKALQQSGDLMGAQKIILGELQREFGGAAVSMADPITQLGNAWANVKETIGTAILPLMKDLAEVLKVMFGTINDNGDAINGMGTQFRNLLPDVEGMVAVFAKLADAIYLASTLQNHFNVGMDIHDFGKQMRDIEENLPSKKIGEFFEKFKAGMAEVRKEMAPVQGPKAAPGGVGIDMPSAQLGKEHFPMPFGLRLPEESAALKQLRKDAKGVFDDTRLPVEKWQTDFEKLKELFANKLINRDTFERAMKKGIEGLTPKEAEAFLASQGITDANLTPNTNKFAFAGANSLRTAEGQKQAFSAALAGKFGQTNSDQKKTAVNTEQMKGYLKTLADNAQKQNQLAQANF